MKHISRRDLIKSALAVSTSSMFGSAFTAFGGVTKPTRLADVGWSWEGQGMTGNPGLSIYGLGEGAEYFGLKKVFNCFRPNEALAMEKLSSFEEVVCDITPNRRIHCGERCLDSLVSLYDPTPAELLLAEARSVGNLSLKYPRIKGAYIDDTLGVKRENDDADSEHAITRELYASIYDTLKKTNPNLKLWALVFAEQLYKPDWAGFKPHMEVINLWVWSEKDLRNLDRHVDRCREIFPGKPISLGCFLWDYPSMKFKKGEFEKGHAVSMDLLKLQWESVLKYVAAGKIDSYTILGAYQIDGAPEQARWVRDFIAAN